MLSQVKKIIDPTSRKHVAGRLGAWWDGREYDPELDAEAEGETAGISATPERDAGTDADAPADAATDETAGEATPATQTIPPANAGTDGARITALERMWGGGRFGPAMCEDVILDQMLGDMLDEGDVGMMGADPALLRAWTQHSERGIYASEWRSGALERARRAAPEITIINDDVDRAKAFPDDALAALACVNTIAFADHKAGLVSRAYHVLKDGGRWVIVDTVRTTAKTPPQAFASAWAEPLLVEEEEIDALLEKAKFGEIRKQNLTARMTETARERMNELGASLETTVAEGMSGADGVLFLRELVWELKSWRARLMALEGGALQVVMWSAVKGGTPGMADAEPEAAPEPETETEASADSAGETDDPLGALEKLAARDSAAGKGEDAPGEDAADLDEALFGQDG